MVQLLKTLISTSSISRNEEAAKNILLSYLTDNGCKVNVVGNNLWVKSSNFDDSKPTILLNSHIDTVKPNPSWTLDPFTPTEKDGKLYGLGSNDAGASVVALIKTFLRLRDTQQSYNLILGLSAEEEVSGKNGVEALLKELHRIDFAIVGEPTGMCLAIAEKGLMVVDCEAKGKAGHAARGEGINAIYEALDDIKWFKEYKFPKVSDSLGETKMNLTIINAGTQHNVVPDSCKFTVDVRLTDCYTHEEALSIIRQNVKSSVEPRSMRLRSSGISNNHPFVKRCVERGVQTFGSSTMSDQALMPFNSVKIGPGDSARSHSADEYIYISEIENAIDLYYELLNGFEL